MRIVKYKKCSDSKYKLILEDGRELSFYEDVILKFDLLLHKEINDEILIEADRHNQECDVYEVALHSIENRIKSVYELKKWLEKKEYPEDLIEKAMTKLQEQGYLNDRSYAKSYIHYQMITTSKGPYRIEKELLDKKIEEKIIQEEIQIFSEEEQREKMKKLITKAIQSNRTRGEVILKQKVINDLKTLGYSFSLIQEVISTFSFKEDESLSKKEQEKAIRKYSRKYQGEELKRKVQEYLYRKGLKYEE